MIDFEGYYLVPPDQVAYIETRRGGGDAQYGLFLGLSGGKELGVWYRTEEARKAAYTKLARQVEIGKRQDREDILYRLRLIEACINKTDKRTLRIWKQLQQLLHLETEQEIIIPVQETIQEITVSSVLQNNRAYSVRGGKGAAVSVPVCDARPVLDWRRMRL